MKRILFILLIIFGLIPLAVRAEEKYTFDLNETEKKPYHAAGYVEFKPLLFGLDQDAAFYKLRFFNNPQGNVQLEGNGRVLLEGSYEKDILSLFARINTDLKYGYAGGSERTTFYEAYTSLKPSSSWRIDLGKKTLKWGKGYAWNPVAFVDRPKDPDDPEQALEGYILATADYIKSFAGPLKTFSFTPVLFPVYDHVNDAFGGKYKLNIAGRFYFLLYDTDIDLIFMTGGSRPDRYGLDFSRNITTNLEVHGEYAYILNSQKNVLDASGVARQVEAEAHSYLIGIRYLTAFDLTAIIEYYHNGTGFTQDEMKNYYGLINRGFNTYQATGNTAALVQAQQLADAGYSRANAMANYLYVRFSQKEPFDILYFTPALTWMMNADDQSWSLTPELLYNGFTNWELRLRAGLIFGAGNSEFGEKQNNYRIELRVGYYF
ncbi:MAG: hypothetical protein CVU54_03265 [Deltaproteobacteria bacterium HGW-Deltaproteobacteria-12]|jgi:hypothetical protein|nr:MAG: hypothetical protein CVU54_03265 [Deltaproteobacteria bacterium HGW-Deltaproteobacteria-12]